MKMTTRRFLKVGFTQLTVLGTENAASFFQGHIHAPLRQGGLDLFQSHQFIQSLDERVVL